jgi:2-methylcitrate dehydratase PrpD
MALGIAGSSAGGLGQNFGTMTKPLHAGFSARNGLFAAQLAKEGISADDHILEAERGFGTAFFGREGHDLGKIGETLGNPFKVIFPGINIKPYPCCRGAHKSIDAALALREKIPNMPAEAEQIESVECDLHLDGPTLYHIPQTGLEGKFSIAYCVSLALLKGSVILEDFLDQKLADPALQQLIKKVVNIRIPGEEEVITIKMKDGRSFSHAVRVAKGDAQSNPLSDAEVADKFQSCARTILPARKIKTAVQQMEKLEKVKDFRQFMDKIMGGV